MHRNIMLAVVVRILDMLSQPWPKFIRYRIHAGRFFNDSWHAEVPYHRRTRWLRAKPDDSDLLCGPCRMNLWQSRPPACVVSYNYELNCLYCEDPLMTVPSSSKPWQCMCIYVCACVWECINYFTWQRERESKFSKEKFQK